MDMGNRLITWLHQYGLSTCWERRLWSTAVMLWSVHYCVVACEDVSGSSCIDIPEYLYSFSLGSCDWRMYTMIAAVLTVLLDACKVESLVCLLKDASLCFVFFRFSLAFCLLSLWWGPTLTSSTRGDVNPLTRASPNHTHQCM